MSLNYPAIREHVAAFLAVAAAVLLAGCLILTLLIVSQHNGELQNIKREQNEIVTLYTRQNVNHTASYTLLKSLCEATPGCVIPISHNAPKKS